MNLIKKIRNPYFAFSTSIFMLLFSCTQYEIRNNAIERAFDFSLYESYKKGEVELFKLTNNSSKKSSQNYDNLVSDVNNFYGTDIKVPHNFFETFENSDRYLIEKTSVENGWVSQNDIIIANKIVEDITNKGFDIAMKNLENEILSLNLGDEEFTKKNTFVNLLKIDNEENSTYLNKGYNKSSCYLCCLWAGVVLLLSLASLLSCVTWIMCGFAIYGVFTAIDYMFEQCEN